MESTSAKTPADFLKSIRGKRVVVKLNSGVDYRGAQPPRSYCYRVVVLLLLRENFLSLSLSLTTTQKREIVFVIVTATATTFRLNADNHAHLGFLFFYKQGF